ncbi:MAG: hypothetical protein QME81_18275 [bacterium]|nr:hypothetical protein [bacterium]
MFRSKLFLKMFSTIILVIALFSISIYFYSVPLIEKTLYEAETRSGRTILDSVYLDNVKFHGERSLRCLFSREHVERERATRCFTTN